MTTAPTTAPATPAAAAPATPTAPPAPHFQPGARFQFPPPRVQPPAPGAAAAAAPAPAPVPAPAATAAAAPPSSDPIVNPGVTPDPIVNLDAGASWPGEQITLMHPFIFKGVTYTVIDMRVPTGLDLRKVYAEGKSYGTVDAAIHLSSANGAPLLAAAFHAMRSDDAQALVSQAASFLFGAGSQTSTTSSTTSGSSTTTAATG